MHCPTCRAPMKAQAVAEVDLGDLFALRGIIVRNAPMLVCTADASHEPLVTGEVLDDLSSQLVQQMLLANYPLGGMEIRFLRKAVGLTQQALASVLGVDRVTVARWEGLEEQTVDMPLSIAIRTVLAASKRSPLPHDDESNYQRPPVAKPARIELEAPPLSATG